MTAAEPLSPPVHRVPVTELPPIPPHHAHQFPGPMCLAGGASVKRRLLLPKIEDMFTAIPIKTPKPSVPPVAKSTLWYKQKQDKKQAAGELVKRYTKQRSSNTYTCRKCGAIQLPPDHTQYYDSLFCLRTSLVSLEEWRRKKKEVREEVTYVQ